MHDQLTEAYFYFLFAGFVCAVLYVLTSIAYLASCAVRHHKPHTRVFVRVAIRFALALILGAGGNAVWFALFTGRLYHDADPLVRFMPFTPFILDTSCGAYLSPGTSLADMEFLWVAFAVPCWVLACLGTRALWHRIAAA